MPKYSWQVSHIEYDNWKEKNQKWRKTKNKTKTAKKKNRNYNLEQQTLYREKKISVPTERKCHIHDIWSECYKK